MLTRQEYFAESVIRMVPTWCPEQTDYVVGKSLVSGREKELVYALHPPDDRHRAFLEQARTLLEEEKRYNRPQTSAEEDPLFGIPLTEAPEIPLEKAPSTLEVEVFTRKLAIFWLERFDKTIEWEKLLDYIDSLRYRTYENEAVSVTLVLDPKNDVAGSQDITDRKHQKLLDMAAVSPETFLRLDRHLRFVGYEEAVPAQRDGGFRCAPDFTTIVWDATDPACFVVHRTRRGDVLISRSGFGLIACWRKGDWYVYDRSGLERVFQDVFGSSGWAILDLVFDLSYRRHGALLVYDPDKRVLPRKVSNKESRIRGPRRQRDTTYALLGQGLNEINIIGESRGEQKRRLFAEVASMDGAIIFDDDGIRAFGAMIVTRKDVGTIVGGARTVAMHSARKYGAHPIKVSADGDVTFFYPGEPDIEIRFA